MPRFGLIALVPLAMAGCLSAQTSNGYGFFAPGAMTYDHYTAMTMQLGLGGELGVGKGIGIGAELGALGVREDFSSSAVGVFSANGYYHFVHKESKFDPFVTAGYGMMFRTGVARLFNYGGGVNYWFHRRLGVRLEMRDQAYSKDLHFWGFRIGLAFRM